MRYLARVGEKELAVEVTRRGDRFTVRVDGKERPVAARRAGAALLLEIGGRRLEAIVVREGSAYGVTIGGRVYSVAFEDPLRGAAAAGLQVEGRAEVRSVMPGRVTALLVDPGQEVTKGQGVIVIEAMKMENEIPSPKDGRVASASVKPGDAVEAGALLLTID